MLLVNILLLSLNAEQVWGVIFVHGLRNPSKLLYKSW